MSTFTEQSGKTISEAFDEFNKKNPRIYELFKSQVFKAIRLGKKKISSKQLLGFIRWEIFLQTQSDLFTTIDGEKRVFKINDAFTSRYVRVFIDEFPEHENLFEVRRLRSV